MKRITLLASSIVACILLAVVAANGQLFRHRQAAPSVTPPSVTPPSVNYTSLTNKPGFRSGVYTAGTGLIETTINKSLSQNRLTFPALSLTVTGSQAPVVDFALSSGSVQTLPDALGNVAVSNLQMMTVWTDSLDVTVSCGTTTAFGTSAGTLAVKQGTPWEWDTSNGTATLPFTDWKSLSVTAGTTGSLSGGTAAATNVHVRSSLSQ